jgi:RNase H-like domain found in reverse transcriptase
VGRGAILSQDQEGREVNIAYLSRTLDKHERNYTITEKEMFAVIWSVKKLRPYLLSSPQVSAAGRVVPDHGELRTRQDTAVQRLRKEVMLTGSK